MRVIIKDTSDEAGSWVADYIINRIKAFAPTAEKPFVLGLPTGSTPMPVYHELIRRHRAVDISRQSIHILDGNASDLEKECHDYEEKIKAFGGIELFLGSIGPDGHIAFNEPGSSLVSRTRVKTLNYDTVEANSRFYDNDISKVPTHALTVGVGTVMDAKEVVLIITGFSKARAVREVIEGGINHNWTVSMLQMHEQAVIACDEPATMELQVKTVKYFKDIETIADSFLPSVLKQ